ncbi:helix-turn-helix domain-containing protein [Olivibacter sitiensis]|uniref:helix-turn-helix domain-containing protein n=1 Tax=Olivibacter sitiensis TaxID=376470 RepID=UPI00042260B4|nr:helix-turn-helix transcriptional regulator [Olivibacter sitiensis]
MAKATTPKSRSEWEIVKLVRKRREALKISQAKIANQFDVTPGYIGQIEMETSGSMYTYDQLNKLAIYLKCSLKDFMPEEPLEE